MSVIQIRLRTAMSRRDMSGGTFAAALGVRYAKVYDLAHGGVEPSLDMLCAISETLGVNLHWLLTGTGPMDLPDTDQSEIQLPQGSSLLDPARGADPARSTSRAGTLPEGASCDHAPSGFSSVFADPDAILQELHAKRTALSKRKAERRKRAAQRLFASGDVSLEVVDGVDHVLKEHGCQDVPAVDHRLKLGCSKIGRIFSRAFNVKTQRGGN